MPVPLSEASQQLSPRAASKRLARGAPKRPVSPSPGSAERPGPFVFPLGRFEADANVRSSPPGARSERQKLPGNECLRSPPIRGKPRTAFPQGHAAIERRTSRSCRTLFASFKIEANPDPSARRTFDEKRTPRLDPFAASNRSKLRSFRCRTSMGSKLPASIRLQPGLEANLDPSAAGRRTRSEPLVVDPSRRQRGASSVSSPPDLPHKRERFKSRPVRDIGGRRTSCLLPPGHPPESKPPNLDPSQLEPEQAPFSTAGPHENRNPPATRFREPSRSKRTPILPAAGPEPGTEAPHTNPSGSGLAEASPFPPPSGSPRARALRLPVGG